MIDKTKVKDLIRSYLPQSDPEIIEGMAGNIIQDVEAVIHSMVRQAVSQEKENQYWKKNKD